MAVWFGRGTVGAALSAQVRFAPLFELGLTGVPVLGLAEREDREDADADLAYMSEHILVR